MSSVDSYASSQMKSSGNHQPSRSRSPRREGDEGVGDRVERNNTERVTRTSIESDVILAIQEPYMQQIVTGEKTYEFRKYRLKQTVERIWFYRTAPHSSIEYVCEILPAKTRNPGDSALEEDGLGNKEFNTRHKDWEGYDFAYRILSVYKLDQPITLNCLKTDHGMKSAPRGLIYAPLSLTDLVEWREQRRLR